MFDISIYIDYTYYMQVLRLSIFIYCTKETLLGSLSNSDSLFLSNEKKKKQHLNFFTH